MRFSLKPFDMVSRDVRALAESSGEVYDQQNGRLSHLGGLLSLSGLGLVIWYIIIQAKNISFENTVTPQLLASYGEKFSLEIGCTAPDGCLVAVSWGDENTLELTSSASYAIRNEATGTNRLLEDYNPDQPDEHVLFRTPCIRLEDKEILTIDNFVWSSDPNQSYVHVYYDWNSAPLGAEVPGSSSASGHPLKLLDLAYTLEHLLTTDETFSPYRTSKSWSTTYGSQILSAGSCDTSSIEKTIDGGGTADVRRAELYMSSKFTDVTVSFVDPVYSMAGQVGGVLDLLAYAVTIIMVVYWCVKARFGGWGPLSRQQANKEQREKMLLSTKQEGGKPEMEVVVFGRKI